MDRSQQVKALPVDATEIAAIGNICYERAPTLDKRIARGDDFAGDAWVRWVAVGHRPDPQEAHAANAYPKLVEALRDVMGFTDTSDVAHHWSKQGEQAAYHKMLNHARALLRSLGEDV